MDVARGRREITNNFFCIKFELFSFYSQQNKKVSRKNQKKNERMNKRDVKMFVVSAYISVFDQNRRLFVVLQAFSDESLPLRVPNFLGTRLLLHIQRAEVEWIRNDLFQRTQILLGTHDAQKGVVKVVRERQCAPKWWIIARNHHRIVVGEQNRRGVIANVVDEFKYLIWDWIDFDADSLFFDDLQHARVFDKSKAVADALAAEQDGVDLQLEMCWL